MSLPVYYFPELARLGAGATGPGDAQALVGIAVQLEGDEGRHAATVRRTRTGELIELTDGHGLRARCEVEAVGKKDLTCRVLSVVQESKPRPRIVLVQALARGGRDEQAVETSTEFGAMGFIPWASARTQVSWAGKEDKGITRWEKTALAATKQSRRAWLPSVSGVHTTADLAKELHARSGEREAGRFLALLCHETADDVLAGVLSPYVNGASPLPEEIWVIIGPEGGIDDAECEVLQDAGARLTLLAPTVLRSGTAGAYTLAALGFLKQMASLNITSGGERHGGGEGGGQ